MVQLFFVPTHLIKRSGHVSYNVVQTRVLIAAFLLRLFDDFVSMISYCCFLGRCTWPVSDAQRVLQATQGEMDDGHQQV